MAAVYQQRLEQLFGRPTRALAQDGRGDERDRRKCTGQAGTNRRANHFDHRNWGRVDRAAIGRKLTLGRVWLAAWQ